MNKSEKFKQVFGIYAEEFWAKPEREMLEWIAEEFEERTAKVNELCGKWGKCECGVDVFRPDTEGWKYCPYCGRRLEWE